MKNNFNKVICVFILLLSFAFLGLRASAEEAKPLFADWDENAYIHIDPLGDVSGSYCDSETDGKFFDIQKVKVSNDDDYFYFYWEITGDENGEIGCNTLAFALELDIDGDKQRDIFATYEQVNCTESNSARFALFADGSRYGTVPTALYIFEPSDFIIDKNTFQLRVPRVDLMVPGLPTVFTGNTIGVQMWVGNTWIVEDTVISCSDNIDEMFSYTAHKVTTPIDFGGEPPQSADDVNLSSEEPVLGNNIKIPLGIVIALITLVLSILAWRRFRQ